jgi:hypothetical protein
MITAELKKGYGKMAKYYDEQKSSCKVIFAFLTAGCNIKS